MFGRLAFWKTKGMNPSVIYDIGANDGTWTREAQRVFPNARYEQFEANKHHAAAGRHITMLGDEEKDVEFYKSTTDTVNTGASMYLEVSDHYTSGKYITEVLPMVTLDGYVKRNNLPHPDMMKLDVQGAELTVLRGSSALLRNTKYVLMEVGIHRWNKDAPMIEEVIRFMTERDYYVIDIIDTHFVSNYLIQIDMLFAHKSTELRRENFYAA